MTHLIAGKKNGYGSLPKKYIYLILENQHNLHINLGSYLLVMHNA